MGGFGSGPFGSGPFGEWKWSRRVLFETIPEIYKQQDLESGGFLELFAEALRAPFDESRRRIRDFLDIRDPLLVRTQYNQVRRLKLGPVLGEKGAVEQRGVTASVDGLQQLVAPTARFRVSDVGKPLFISGSTFLANNRKVTISRVTSNTTVVTDPILVVDAGPLRWEVRTKLTPPTDRITVEIRSGDISDIAPSWLVFDGFADFTVLARRQFKIPVRDNQLLTEQEGIDGVIDNLGRFSSVTANLDQLDVGKPLTLVKSTIPTNNGKFEITRVVQISPGDVRAELSADPVLSIDAGLTWAVLPYGELDLSGTTPPRGIIEQEGTDLKITASDVSTATITSASASFSMTDIGKELSIRGSTTSPVNDGIYKVSAVSSTTSVLITQRSPVLIVETTNPLTWELRTPTLIGDLTQVDARATSMITSLAPDFGIEIDTQESEDRQRSWVRNVSQWTNIKGTSDAYRIIGQISGFDISTFQLFRATPALFELAPSGNVFEVGEAGSGRSGSDAVLGIVLSRVQLLAPSALFVATDAGRQIRLTLASNPGNNKLYTIESVISPTQVEFVIEDLVDLPDVNNGSLGWAVVRLYANLPPLRPRFDEVRSDVLEQIVETTSNNLLTFRVDKYCWEDDFSSTARIDVLSVATLTPGVHQVSVTGTLDFPTTPEVITGIGHWEFVSLVEGETDSGNLLTGTAPEITLFASVANFGPDLVGQWILITSASTTANNGLFQILSVISATSLTFFNAFGVGEGFSGEYQIFRELDLFVDSVPVLTPVLSTVVASGNGDAFLKIGIGVETRLTDAAGLFSAGMVGKHLRIVGATTPGNNGIFVIKTFISSTAIVYENSLGATEAYSGAWSIGLGIYTLNVSSAVPPTAPGPGQLRYACDTLLSCDYCGSNKVMAIIEATPELLSEGDIQVERLLERVISRLEEVKPAHVELITQYRASVEASLVLSAVVEPV